MNTRFRRHLSIKKQQLCFEDTKTNDIIGTWTKRIGDKSVGAKHIWPKTYPLQKVSATKRIDDQTYQQTNHRIQNVSADKTYRRTKRIDNKTYCLQNVSADNIYCRS